MSTRHCPPPACLPDPGLDGCRRQRRTERRATLAWLGALALGCTGCTSKPKAPPPVAQAPALPPPPAAPPPTLVTLILEGSAALNPDARDRPSPLQVRVYELSSRAAFDRTDFNTLYATDTDALGATLLDKQEFVLDPGGKVRKQWSPPDGTKYLGVLAAFRSLERSIWRQAVAIHAHEMQEIFVRLEARSLAMSATLLD